MLKTKHRFLLLLAIVATIGGASLVNQVAVYLNINPQDPLLFDRTQMFAMFSYNDGFTEMPMTLLVTHVETNWANVSVTIGSSTFWMTVTPDGFINATSFNTLFWLHVPNPLTSGTSFGINLRTVFNVTDPIGLIGPAGVNYTAIVEDKLVYWPTEYHLHGAQYSFIVVFRNMSNNAIVGQGMYDSTCGLLFSLQGGSPYTEILLIDTNYEISRNRMMSWPWALGLSTGITILAYLYMKKKTQLDNEIIQEITLLMGAGVAVAMVDVYVDVWLYTTFGFMGNLLLHLSVAFGLLIICVYQGYKIKCTIPAFLEVAFLIPMVLFMGENYVPHMTAFMGLFISWLIMIFISGYPPQPKSATKIGRFLSEFL
ncbi:MAG: hypothetical protein ACTSRS_12805 [Candidatus Helarchaeota archaeon]